MSSKNGTVVPGEITNIRLKLALVQQILQQPGEQISDDARMGADQVIDDAMVDLMAFVSKINNQRS